jgi:uncharacterized protein YcbK (DUF882 family)
MISKHFSRDEFACKCGCGFDTVDIELIAILEDVREHFDKPIKINSGCRCAKHNKAVGGEANSLHMIGRAADFVVQGPSPAKVYQYLTGKYPEQYGIGIYPTWVHADSRTTKARWLKT